MNLHERPAQHLSLADFLDKIWNDVFESVKSELCGMKGP